MKNQISVIGLLDERSLWEEEVDPPMSYGSNSNGYGGNGNAATPQDFVCLAEAPHGYPATKVEWQPSTANKAIGLYTESGMSRELLASTADGLRIWEYTQNPEGMGGQFAKSTPSPLSGRLQQRVVLTGVRVWFVSEINYIIAYTCVLKFISTEQSPVQCPDGSSNLFRME
jgi:DDB1- and CUL4-associated factor 7